MIEKNSRPKKEIDKKSATIGKPKRLVELKHQKLLVSALFVEPGKVGGAEHYLTNILKVIEKAGAVYKTKLVLDQNVLEQYDPTYSNFDSNLVNVRFNRRLYDLLLKLIVKVDYDIMFQPQYITPLWIGNEPCVTTIHDLKYLHYPEYTSSIKKKWLNYTIRHTLKRASRVVCISNFVKSDILRFFGSEYEQKLEVIHNPVDFQRFKSTTPKEIEPYILSVNSQWEHKNTLSLLKAYKLAKTKNPELPRLVLVGQLPENLLGGENVGYQEILKRLVEENPDVTMTGYVDDQSLGSWYRGAELFVNTSLFEGFGMTVVESMGLGIPTLTTKTSSLYEVTMGKAWYIDDPLDIQHIADRLISAYLNRRSISEEVRTVKDQIIERYHPMTIATSYLDLFEQVLKDSEA